MDPEASDSLGDVGAWSAPAAVDRFNIMKASTADLTELAEQDMEPVHSLGFLDTSELPRQRQRLKVFRKGDDVDVFSFSRQRWHHDGEVTHVATESCTIGSTQVWAGSMRVLYDHKQRFKWVAPQEMEKMLRRSVRPRAPGQVVGSLLRKQEYWLSTEWPTAHLKLRKGCLQVWNTAEEAIAGVKPDITVDVSGLVETSVEGTCLHMWSNNGQESTLCFRATAEEVVASWEQALWEHFDYLGRISAFEEEEKQRETRTRSWVTQQQDGPLELPGVPDKRSFARTPHQSGSFSESLGQEQFGGA